MEASVSRKKDPEKWIFLGLFCGQSNSVCLHDSKAQLLFY